MVMIAINKMTTTQQSKKKKIATAMHNVTDANNNSKVCNLLRTRTENEKQATQIREGKRKIFSMTPSVNEPVMGYTNSEDTLINSRPTNGGRCVEIFSHELHESHRGTHVHNGFTVLHEAAMYDQNMSVGMLNSLLDAGSMSTGRDIDDFRHPLRNEKLRLTSKLEEIRHKGYYEADQSKTEFL